MLPGRSRRRAPRAAACDPAARPHPAAQPRLLLGVDRVIRSALEFASSDACHDLHWLTSLVGYVGSNQIVQGKMDDLRSLGIDGFVFSTRTLAAADTGQDLHTLTSFLS